MSQNFHKPFPTVLTRHQDAQIRRENGLLPATYNYEDPTPEMHNDPIWQAIWDEIKTWDVNIPTEYTGYMGVNGNHATAIYKAVMARIIDESETL